MQPRILRAHTTKTPDQLRKRIADYARLRRMAVDEHTVDALDSLISDAKDQLHLVERH